MKCVAISLVSILPIALVACDQTGPSAPPEPPATSSAPSSGNMPHDHHHGFGSAPGSASGQQQDRAQQSQEPPSDPTVAEFLGLQAPKPASWQWQPPRNPMITTNYSVPAPSNVQGAKAAQLNVYFFGEGMGGSVRENIDRWKNQFRSADGYEVEPKVDEFEVDEMPVTFVELEGEWMQMGAAWYTKDQLFLAAIVDAPAGRIFIRFAGDEKTISHNREPFMEMIHGLRRIEGAVVEDSGAPYDTGYNSGGY